MVVVNLTLLVELGLFLLFLWAMQRWVIKPLLVVMDERREKVRGDREAAVSAEARAAELEADVFARRREFHREASYRAQAAHREAQEKHLQEIDDLRKREEREVAEVREQAEAAITAERGSFAALAESLADEIAKDIGAGAGAR